MCAIHTEENQNTKQNSEPIKKIFKKRNLQSNRIAGQPTSSERFLKQWRWRFVERESRRVERECETVSVSIVLYFNERKGAERK